VKFERFAHDEVKMLRAVFTAFMAHHGATIAERGLDQLGVGSCGKAPDLNLRKF
jgi:hypothetical protein